MERKREREKEHGREKQFWRFASGDETESGKAKKPVKMQGTKGAAAGANFCNMKNIF